MIGERPARNEKRAVRHRPPMVGDFTAVILAVALAVVGLVRVARVDGPILPRRGSAVETVLTLKSDPSRFGMMVRADGETSTATLEVVAFGARGRQLERRAAGEQLHVIGFIEGKSRPHLRLVAIADWSAGSPLSRSANRVRSTMSLGVANLPADDRSLFLGLVLGDDRGQRRETVAAFRHAGLSHLTAVSGQNVAYILVLLRPLLQRFTMRRRWVATTLVILWFAVLTRLEPSVLRASVMAIVALTSRLLGREIRPWRLIALTVGTLAVITPSVLVAPGFWLSLSATSGLLLLSPRLSRMIPAPAVVAEAIGATLAAQIGVLPIQLLLFGVPSPIALPANLLAGPVAGLVMVWGLPAGLLAGVVRPIWPPLANVVTFPALLGTRWVSAVATVAASVPTPLAWLATAAMLVWAVARLRSSRDGFCAPGEGIRRVARGHGAARSRAPLGW